jgi:PAS domain S-box-containing protein
MATQLRKTGISVVGDMHWGTHFCHFYQTKQDLLDILVPYFKAGLENSEFCLWVVSDSDLITVEEAQRALAQAVPNLDSHLSDESIEILNRHDWYFEQDALNLERARQGWDERLKRALARGYQGMRASADTFWLGEKDWKDFFSYEKQVHDWITNKSMTVMCTYPLAKSGATEVLDVVQAHQFAIARRHGEWEVIESPQLIQAKAEIEKLNEELEQRVVERTQELAATNEELRKEIGERKRAEDALRGTEDRLRLVIDTVPALIHTGLPDGQLDFFNQRWLDFVGLSLEDLSGWKWTAAIHPEDVAAMVERWRAALATGEPYEHEARVRRADGEYRWMVHREVPVRDELGNIVKWYASSIDIEDRKQAEDALRRSEDRLRLVIDTIPVMAWSMRPDGVVDFLNQRWMDYAGLSLEQYVQDPTGPVHPEDLPRIVETWRQNMAAGEPNEDEIRLRQADGEYRWFLVRNSPLRDEQGNVVKWYGVSVDIEERKVAEEELRRTHWRVESVLNSVSDTHILLDWDWRAIYVNEAAARAVGRPREEIIGHTWWDLFPDIVGTELARQYHRAMDERIYVAFEYYYPTTDTWWENRFYPAPAGLSVFATNITERKVAEEKTKATSAQLRALSARLQSAREEEATRIAREVHDELGAALSSLRWDIEEIAEAISSSGEQLQVQELRDRIPAMINLIDTTMNTVRRIASELRPIGLDALGLRETIEWQARQFQERTGILVQCDFDKESIDLRGEQATAVFRIFQEALTNVLRHAQATKVNLELNSENGEFRFTIRDNGRGITEKEKSSRRALGLLGMRERAHLIGGSLEITASNKGTAVSLRIPIPTREDS